MHATPVVEKARESVTDESVKREIDTALKQTFYNESDQFPPPDWGSKS